MPKQFRDKYSYLAGRFAVVTGSHPKKGTLVEIKQSLGNGLVTIAGGGAAQWIIQVKVTQLLDARLAYSFSFSLPFLSQIW